MIELTDKPIDPGAMLAKVTVPEAGAVVLFLGVTREVTDERVTESLDYECYPEMARSKLGELRKEAQVGKAGRAQIDPAADESRGVVPP